MGFRVDNGQVATLHLQRFAKDCQHTLARIPLFLHSCSPSAELGGSYRSWYNHSSSFTIASVRIENHLRSWRRHQVLASWQSSQLNLVLPQSSCSTLVKISGRMLLVRLPGKPPNTRGGGKIHAADSKAWSLQEITSLDEDFSLEENSSLEDASVLRKTAPLRKRNNDTISTLI